MSFNIALTGLAAAQKDLDTTANNIANVNTTGFKESRAEFASVYASSVFSAGKTKNGDGVSTTMVAQQFHQGSLNFTQNSLDLAITGEGYFATSEDLGSQDYTFTRAGAFKLNKDNFIVDANGNFLQGFPVDPSTGDTTSVSLSTSSPLQIPDASGSPRATTNVYSSFNLDSTATAPTIAFDPDTTASYNSSTSTTVYDSLGEPHTLQLFFRKEDPATDANEWQVYATLGGKPFDANGSEIVAPAAITPITEFGFNAQGFPAHTGAAETANTGTTFNSLNLTAANVSGLLTNGATFPSDIQLNWRDEANTTNKLPTQFASRFEVKALDQDGATTGRLAGIDIGSDGKIVASYSNGDSTFLGQVAMVRFSNSQGLTEAGNTGWKKSLTSGEPIAGEPGSGTLGTINSSALEQSNVNLTNELVDLISAQRNFQANSRALEVNSTLQQNILQIR
ncbi:flagellar hook protein FlgE [Pseudoalteromonas luteoviolacea]|uniref:Flagellar hook protein FlgE n=1 Tax=Pseudoalteromonas luteoviolacea S4054 TaxID=1129367 RepID=A0A0F6A7X3_9GAMM|nr:flagellar hook protein FlgE [Pseudoalteromonas luteoviolacea]AOT07434.1 flagellar biosynthesis protein FlgE [Pseudoalteromonas luteoviolacea]AOT12350.1 flagellar biosynthesis protein FlgE [Pseudoalteromonas luteoviolacea]AOT17263.1 flagellar biosynthesis protein FlgE [Pseudoalteromonas luteoviolacea]KKE81946.1 flagellar hook protein FlgE [Pseudoalteromonas luteoviolacea S4054]KZN74140.1 flagellar hook protein FlgE [Pseudoalteromonas luteoviolacea S4047-1]